MITKNEVANNDSYTLFNTINDVKICLKMSDFTIYKAIDRIKNEGDIFKPVLSNRINLEKVIKQFNKQ